MPPSRDRGPTSRRDVAVAGHTGDEGTARAGLTEPDPAVRATALGALDRLGRLTPQDIATAVTDESATVRARAAELTDIEPVLFQLLDDHEPLVVEAACFKLGELGEKASNQAVDRLALTATGHPDPLCREAAVAALGAIGKPEGLTAILAGTDDKPAVRRRAVLALAPFEGPDVDAALERALTDRDWQVRQAAEDLTGRLTS
jgi:HEAT repeat protein